MSVLFFPEIIGFMLWLVPFQGAFIAGVALTFASIQMKTTAAAVWALMSVIAFLATIVMYLDAATAGTFNGFTFKDVFDVIAVSLLLSMVVAGVIVWGTMIVYNKLEDKTLNTPQSK